MAVDIIARALALSSSGGAEEIKEMIGQPNGIASLNDVGKVPSEQLPSYVDDVVEYPTRDDFPVSGESGIIYIAQDSNISYRWTGTQYIAIASNDYNQLINTPIINANLAADGFTPVVGTYYKHIGSGEPSGMTPFAVGDTISSIKFDRSKSKDEITNFLAGLSRDAEGKHTFIGSNSLDLDIISYDFGDFYTINNGALDQLFNSNWGFTDNVNEDGVYNLPSACEITTVDSTEGWNGILFGKDAGVQSDFVDGTIYKCTSTSPSTYIPIGDNSVWEAGSGEHSIQTKDTSCDARGAYAVAEGQGTFAESDYSHAEGWVSRTIIDDQDLESHGHASHAEGSHTIAKGAASHAEGNTTESMGMYSHAEGSGTISGGRSSHAEGDGTIAQNVAEHAEGLYNKSHSIKYGDSKNTLHSIGIGSSMSDRKNALEIMQNGDAYLFGVGDYDGTNIDEARTIQADLNNKLDKAPDGANNLIDSNNKIDTRYMPIEDINFEATGWTEIESGVEYTKTVATTKHPIVCYNSSNEVVFVSLSYNGTNVTITAPAAFAGHVLVI